MGHYFGWVGVGGGRWGIIFGGGWGWVGMSKVGGGEWGVGALFDNVLFHYIIRA